MGKKQTEDTPPQDEAQDVAPEVAPGESSAAEPIQRSAMDDPSHPLHHLKDA